MSTAIPTFTQQLTAEEQTELYATHGLKGLNAYKKFIMDSLLGPTKKMIEDKANDSEKKDLAELEAIEKAFNELLDVKFKVDVGGVPEELSVHDALFGVPRTIKVKARKGEEGETEDREISVKIDKAVRTAFIKSITRVKDIMQANPMRERSSKDLDVLNQIPTDDTTPTQDEATQEPANEQGEANPEG